MNPTEKLNNFVNSLAAEGITTASEYAAFLNKKNSGRIVEDQNYWESLNIYTARDLIVMLDMADFSDTYKEMRGFRPRGFSYDDAMRWLENQSDIDYP